MKPEKRVKSLPEQFSFGDDHVLQVDRKNKSLLKQTLKVEKQKDKLRKELERQRKKENRMQVEQEKQDVVLPVQNKKVKNKKQKK
jgi:hypothetical protein